MTTLRNPLFRMLCETTIFQLVSVTQRRTKKKCPDNILQGPPDNKAAKLT